MKIQHTKIIKEDKKTVTIQICMDTGDWTFRYARVTIPKDEFKRWDWTRYGGK
jgi:hypothetical protein